MSEELHQRPESQPGIGSRGAAKRRPPTEATPSDSSPPAALYWLPQGAEWDQVPANIKRAVSDIIVPAYRHFVEEAADEMERMAGLTYVQLLWLEVCQQVQMAFAVAKPNSVLAELTPPNIPRYFELMNAKGMMTELMMKLRVTRQMLQRYQETPCGAITEAPRLPVSPLQDTQNTPIIDLPSRDPTTTDEETGK